MKHLSLLRNTAIEFLFISKSIPQVKHDLFFHSHTRWLAALILEKRWCRPTSMDSQLNYYTMWPAWKADRAMTKLDWPRRWNRLKYRRLHEKQLLSMLSRTCQLAVRIRKDTVRIHGWDGYHSWIVTSPKRLRSHVKQYNWLTPKGIVCAKKQGAVALCVIVNIPIEKSTP